VSRRVKHKGSPYLEMMARAEKVGAISVRKRGEEQKVGRTASLKPILSKMGTRWEEKTLAWARGREDVGGRKGDGKVEKKGYNTEKGRSLDSECRQSNSRTPQAKG